MADAKSESSIEPSSPLSPNPIVYYDVQSPTESQKYENSSHPLTTPSLYQTPTDSPSIRSSSFGHSANSRVSKFSRLALKRNERKRLEGNRIDVKDHIKNGDEPTCCRCHCLIAIFVLLAIFFLACSIIWTASMPFKPQIVVKSLKVHNFYLGQGSDTSGVQTKMITINSTLNLFIHNPATFFGIHLNVHPIHLLYSEFVFATGQLEGYYQRRKSSKLVSVKLEGRKLPLYGAGRDLSLTLNSHVKIPVRLELDAHSIGHVIGKLVKARHELGISCSLSIDPNGKFTPIYFKQHSCTNR